MNYRAIIRLYRFAGEVFSEYDNWFVNIDIISKHLHLLINPDYS